MMGRIIRRNGWAAMLLALLALLGGPATSHGQARSSASAAATPPAIPVPPAAVSSAQRAPEPFSPIPAMTQEIAQLRGDVREMEASITADIATVRPTWWERLTPAGIGLVGVFVGGFFSWLLQRRQMKLSLQLLSKQLKENERINRAKAGYESMSKVIDYQTKQVNEFYSPLRLMLRRSSGVRRQLTDQLHAKSKTRFTYVTEADKRDHLFVVDPDGSQKRFRLIEHMHELATSHKELMPLVQEIVSIGVAMSELILTKGGMAITDSDQLTEELLGQYLAHFSILRDVVKKAGEEPELLAELQYNVVYSPKLDAALEKDMKVLTDQIEEWKKLSRQMWQEAGKAPMPGASSV